MIQKEKHTVPCPVCEKSFPIVLHVDTEQPTGSKSKEVRCPFCEHLLTIQLPDGLSANETVLRGSKKPE